MAKLKDKFYNRVIEGPLKLDATDDVKEPVESLLSSGEVENAITVNVNSAIEKGVIQVGGTKLYRHLIEFPRDIQSGFSYEFGYEFSIINTSSEPISFTDFNDNTELIEYLSYEIFLNIVNFYSNEHIEVAISGTLYVNDENDLYICYGKNCAMVWNAQDFDEYREDITDIVTPL